MLAWRNSWMPELLLCLSLIGCADKGDQPVGSLHPAGTPASYNYKAFNAGGALAVSGTLVLTSSDSGSVSGSWAFVAVLPSEKVGPQVGNGKAAGTMAKSSVTVNLNPGWADNNVILQGTVASDRITGRWSWISFIGPTAEGAFEAIRVPSIN